MRASDSSLLWIFSSRECGITALYPSLRTGNLGYKRHKEISGIFSKKQTEAKT